MARRYKTSKEKRVAQKRYRRQKKQYQDYLRQFEARKETFYERGLDFYDPNALTFRDWKTVHAEKINDLKLDIKEGKRKTVGNVNREIVSDQAYELSSRQADVLGEYLLENEYDYLEEMDLVYKYTDEQGQERQGEFIKEDIGLWDMINDFRAQYFAFSKDEQAKLMKKWGVDTYAKAVKKEVGQTFFNSPD